jgi:PAS domain-containing protein
MNQKIRDYVATQIEPNFFSNTGDEELAIIHTEIQRGIETATDVMTFEIDLDVMLRAQAFLATIGWTLEEACILYLYWFIECPKEAIAWDKAYQIQRGDECENHRMDGMA